MTEHIVVVTVVDDGGALSGSWTVDGEAAEAVGFTNTYRPEPASLTLPVKKVITGNPTPTDKTFDFTLTAVDGAPMPAANTLTITGAGTASFGEIRYTAAGTYTYKVRETEEETEAGYTYDMTEHIVVVMVVDDGGALSGSWTVDGEAAEAVDFTNSYTPAPAKLALPVNKTIQYVTPPTDKVFTFTLTAAGGAPMPATDTLTIVGANQAAFGEITYTQAGAYAYSVKEEAGTDTGYTYDAAEHAVVVTVVDNDGTLRATWTVNGESAEAVSFTNNYQPLPTELKLPVSKSLTGQTPPENAQFTFEVSAATDGTPLPASTEATVVGAGSAQFGAIEFAGAGTYVYTVTERNTDAAGYTYDSTVYTVTVVVTDNDGQLEASWTAERQNGSSATEILFTNNYEPAATTIALPVQKLIEGNATPADKTFRFSLTALDGAPMPDSSEATITGTGAASFGTISYTVAGTYAYTVKERAGSDPGYTYDKTEYTVAVTVVDHGGMLSASWAATPGDPSGDAALLFTNTYVPAPVAVTLPVRKVITGNEVPTDQDFSFTLTAVDGAPMPAADTLTITGANAASFGEIAYTAAGVYTYKMKEVAGGQPGYGYDAAEHTIVVVVTDVNGVLNTTWTSDAAAVPEVVFINSYAPGEATLSLPVKKTVSGESTPTDKRFDFTLTAVNGAPMPADAQSGVSKLTIVGSGMSAFGIITYGTAGEYRYELRETAGSDAGYAYDDTVYEIVVTVTDENAVLTATWTAGDGDVIAFENVYTPVKAMLTIPVEKIIEGNPPLDKQFTFELMPTGNEPMPTAGGNLARVTGAGSGEFGAIEYARAGTYAYTVHERAGSDAGYIYDTAVYDVIVTVVDNGGVLVATYAASTDAGDAEAIAFTNRYVPAQVDLALGATKTLKNKSLTEGMFAFTLADETGKIIQTVRNAADGSVTFDPITYTEPGVYGYTIAEVKGNLSGVAYDKATHKVRVTVTDEDGVLVAVADKLPDAVKFVNDYRPDIPKTGYGEDNSRAVYVIGMGALLALVLLAMTGKKRSR